MKLTLTLTATLALSGVVFALRHRQLQSLTHQAGILRLHLVTPLPATPSPSQAVTFDPQSILDTIKSSCSRGTYTEAESSALRTRINGLAVDDLRTLCGAARQEPSPPPGFLAAVAGWSTSVLDGKDEALAPEFFAAMPQDDPTIARELTNLLRDWTEKDPGAASAWLKQAVTTGALKGSPQRKDLERLLTQAAAMLAPVAQLPHIRSLPEEEQVKLLGPALFRLQSAEDTRAFAAAIITWPTAKPRDMALDATMEKLLDHGGFDATAAWLDGLPDATPEQKNTARLSLAMRDPLAAEMPERAMWIISNSAPPEQTDLAARVTKDWLWHDYNAAGAWLHENRTAPWFDAAASAFATGIAHKEPTTAFDWTLAISDEAIRRAALQEVMRLWRRSSPDAADDYLKTSTISEEWKAALTGEAAPSPTK